MDVRFDEPDSNGYTGWHLLDRSRKEECWDHRFESLQRHGCLRYQNHQSLYF
jgi:hypothetical protein